MYINRLKLNTVLYNAVERIDFALDACVYAYTYAIGIILVIVFTWNLWLPMHLKLLNCY